MEIIFEFLKKNRFIIFQLTALLFATLLLFSIEGGNFNIVEPPKKLVGVVTIETMANTSRAFDKKPQNEEEKEKEEQFLRDEKKIQAQEEIRNLSLDPVESFCEHHRESGSKLHESCQMLTEDNCLSTSCCGWLNGSKCVAGSADGPRFKTEGRVPIQIDTYYYQNKCSGIGCR